MLLKTKTVAKFQEFMVKDYTIEELKDLTNLNISSFKEILGPPLLCLLPGTKFYVGCPKKPFKNILKVPNKNGVYEILIHPKAIGADTKELLYLTIKIDFPDWCKTGRPINFPLVESHELNILDPFKTKQRMLSRGLPPYVVDLEKMQKTEHTTVVLNTMKSFGLEKTKHYQELEKNATKIRMEDKKI